MSTLGNSPDGPRQRLAAVAFDQLYTAMRFWEQQNVLIPCTADGPARWDAKRILEQKRACAECPVKELCLKAGELTPTANGVWGGKHFGRRNEQGRPPGGKLGVTRLQVKQLLAAGYAIPVIAGKLQITEQVVRYHHKKIIEEK